MRIFASIFALMMFAGVNAQTHVFKPLPYAYDALEPYIDTKTMEIHYSKHHRGYYDKFMAAIKGNSTLESLSMPEIMARMDEFPAAVRNNGGGYWNHEFFWESMTPIFSSAAAKPAAQNMKRTARDKSAANRLPENIKLPPRYFG